jgi:hypothetical protein
LLIDSIRAAIFLVILSKDQQEGFAKFGGASAQDLRKIGDASQMFSARPGRSVSSRHNRASFVEKRG